jgi:hypothetical protein
MQDLLVLAAGRRVYASDIARWLTLDPFGYRDGINRYVYVQNRPLVFADPTGTWGVTQKGGARTFDDRNPGGTGIATRGLRSTGGSGAESQWAFAWEFRDLDSMAQRVTISGTFQLQDCDGLTSLVVFQERYVEIWTRPENNEITDYHRFSTRRPANYLATELGGRFQKIPVRRLQITTAPPLEVCAWQFNLTAKFELANCQYLNWLGGNAGSFYRVPDEFAVTNLWLRGVIEPNPPIGNFSRYIYPNQGQLLQNLNPDFPPDPSIRQNGRTLTDSEELVASWESGEADAKVSYKFSGYK